MSEVPSLGLPDAPKLDLNDPFSWALAGRVHARFLREVAPQFGMDASKLVLGDVLASIIGDDENSFGIKAAPYREMYGQIGKRQLLERLDWEVGEPELPDTIRQRLGNVMDEISVLDWSQEAEFLVARNVWTKKAKHFTKHQIALYHELRGAIYYHAAMAKQLSEPWQIYLYGSKQY